MSHSVTARSIKLLCLSLLLAGVIVPTASAATQTAPTKPTTIKANSAKSSSANRSSYVVPTKPNPDHRIVLSGTKNTRDMGGIKTADGKWQIRPKALIRSDRLYKLDDHDVTVLSHDYNVKNVVDFRTPGQVAGSPDAAIPGAPITYLSIFGPQAAANHGLGDGDFYGSRLELGYYAITGYRQFLNRLLTNQGATLFHCVTGKDRTGVAAVLILSALGMDKQTTVDDFMLSNYYYDREAVKQSWIDEYYQVISQNYTNISNYLTRELNFPVAKREQLKARYLVSTDGKNTPYSSTYTTAKPSPSVPVAPTPSTPKPATPAPVTKPSTATTVAAAGQGDTIKPTKKAKKTVKITVTKKRHTNYIYRLKGHKVWFKDAHLKHSKGKTSKSAKTKWRIIKQETVKINGKKATYLKVQDHHHHTAWILKKYVVKIKQ
ncbi:tyrosine-protein phosphatase [Levilactobacillus yonginensis]|uniref:tyrosine-protein phosphatase n=1 Tax=Levilactobacillus yonginensis TaxID=1054041 RepID=UPI00345D1131